MSKAHFNQIVYRHFSDISIIFLNRLQELDIKIRMDLKPPDLFWEHCLSSFKNSKSTTYFSAASDEETNEQNGENKAGRYSTDNHQNVAGRGCFRIRRPIQHRTAAFDGFRVGNSCMRKEKENIR